jgi:hypothetical protein
MEMVSGKSRESADEEFGGLRDPCEEWLDGELSSPKGFWNWIVSVVVADMLLEQIQLGRGNKKVQ